MLNIKQIRYSQYWVVAFCLWFLAFLTLRSASLVSNLTYLFILLPFLFTARYEEIKPMFKSSIFILLIIWLINFLIAISSTYSSDFFTQLKYTLILLLFYMSITKLPELDVETVYKLFIWFFATIVIYTVISAALGLSTDQWSWGKRLLSFPGGIDNAIYVTSTLTATLAVLSYCCIRLQKFKIITLIHIISIFLALFILQTRSFLPTWGVITLLLIFNAKKLQYTSSIIIKNKTKIWIILIFLSLILAAILFTDSLQTRLHEKSYRLEIWHGYWQAIQQCGIIFGCGLYPKINFVTSDGMAISHAHNIVLTNFSKAGLFGTIPLLCLIAHSIWFALKEKHWAGWMLTASISSMMFDSKNLITHPNELWLLIHFPMAVLIHYQLRIHKKHIKPLSHRIKNSY